jgi:hypothetical protein
MGDAIDAATLAAALRDLVTAIAALNANAGGGGAGARAPLLDPFASTDPSNLSSRAGVAAYETACSALDEVWDGTPDKLPAFVICLRIRANDVQWNGADPQGILTFGAHNLLTAHHTISAADIEAARAACTDDCAIQNSKTMYECLKKSITGDLRATLFEQASNLPAYADGPSFFKLMLSLTTVSSLQLSIISFNQILQFDPAIHHFNVPTINTKLSHLFTLAMTSSRLLAGAERIQHTLTVYQRIRQPKIWAQWIRNQVDSFEYRNITNCQAFMNMAVVKYNKIRVETEDHAFRGSASTLQEDIVAMMAASKRKRIPNPNDNKPKPVDNDSNKERRNQTALPSFARHFKGKEADGGKAFKVGDTKKWKDATWYYCDCPNHRDCIKWYTHTAEDCRTRKNWLDKGGAKLQPSPMLMLKKRTTKTLQRRQMLTKEHPTTLRAC